MAQTRAVAGAESVGYRAVAVGPSAEWAGAHDELAFVAPARDDGQAVGHVKDVAAKLGTDDAEGTIQAVGAELRGQEPVGHKPANKASLDVGGFGNGRLTERAPVADPFVDSAEH